MAAAPALPTLQAIASSDDLTSTGPLAGALSTLFEPSPVLFSHLVPQLHRTRDRASALTYQSLISDAARTIATWDPDLQASFIGAHPRIGEVNGLSALSAAEQAARATPPEVLERLGVLNAAYEVRYEGLRYITFVNGRSRKEIMEEMEAFLGVGKGDIDLQQIASSKVTTGGEAWLAEVKRAVHDVGQIARSRLRALGIDEEVPRDA
ncbi:hypothetical protein DENSPDRAFT_544640 [Dentipellis sp. KUC8613]|nr:hypothetical protein DENSPDRAFT_544640 [Dentipellis sp. KUC8613]